MPARRTAAVVPFLFVTLFLAQVIVPASPARADDIQNLTLVSTSVRFDNVSLVSECVVPPSDGICTAPYEAVFSPATTVTVNCPQNGCVLELQTCMEYSTFSASGAPLFGGTLQFTVDGSPQPSHILVRVATQSLSNACFRTIVSGRDRGPHTVGLEVAAEVFGGVEGDSTELSIHKANVAVRVYRD